VWIKRDDQSGSDLSGNKVRKLEYLLAEAMASRCDTVITCGGIQSNHCRATAVAARRLGMDSVVFLRGERPASADGNLLLDLLVGARPVFITPEDYARRGDLMRAEAQRLAADGRRPYVIPEGGSNALGSWGYVGMLEELDE
jgi:D-cysteine desulfhydrase